MEYDITPQRQAYLDARGFTILTACPGSGKTTSIVKKLCDVMQFCQEKYGLHTGVACLSFTNKACEELAEKFRDMHNEGIRYPHIVSTIDSFVLQYIVLPFWYLCDWCGARPTIINDEQPLLKMYYNRYVKDGVVMTYLTKDMKPYGSMLHQKSPHKIERRSNAYYWNNSAVSSATDKAYCEAAFKYRLKRGFITSSDAVWIACYILTKHENVAKALVQRFPYVIVDESQDCSELQFYIFSKLKDAGLKNLEYVGDVCQAIYEYRNAKPDYLQNLKTQVGWNDLPLTECRRSNQRIINLYSLLKSSDIPAIKSYGVEDKGIEIRIYPYDDGNKRDIIRHFNNVCDNNGLGKRMILARGHTLCRELAGVKIQKFKFWNASFPNLLIDAKFRFDEDDLESAFRKARLAVMELICSEDPRERRAFLLSVEHDVEFNARIFELLRSIPSLSLSFTDWASQMGAKLKVFCDLEDVPDFSPRKKGTDGISINVLKDMPVEQFYLSSDKNSDYHNTINTIHSSKGATLDGVLLFLSEDSQGRKLSLNDFPKRSIRKMKESQRMIYVACSRATQFLALAVPSSVPEAQIKEALRGVEYKIEKVNLQLDLGLI